MAIYMYIYICIHIFIYIYTYTCIIPNICPKHMDSFGKYVVIILLYYGK